MANEKKVLTIKNNILEKCTNSKFAVDIEIPDGVTEIAREAFAGRCASGCASLLSVVVPDSVKAIRHSAFDYCRNLQKVTLPKELEILEAYVFNNCRALEEIVIPEGISTIEYGTFNFCLNLKKVTLPKSLKVIQEGAFS